jgi:hypothetical protein
MKSHPQQLTLVYDQVYDTKTNRYAEDFIKHVNNVKRRSQNVPSDAAAMLSAQQTISHYEVPKANPKRLDTDAVRNENDNNKISSCCASVDDDLAIKDFDKMLTHNDGKQSKMAPGKATGTVPKLSSSISSTESKVNNPKPVRKHDKENKPKESKRDQTNDDNEGMPQSKVIHSDEKLLAIESFQPSTAATTEKLSPSASLERKMNEQTTTTMASDDKNETQKDLQSKAEQQTKPVEQYGDDDDDDEVFLSSRQQQLNEKSIEQNEKQIVSI